MTGTRYLVHGVFWSAPPATAPVLRLQAPERTFEELGLDGGARLGFRLAAEGRSFLGHHRVHGPAHRDHVRGHQCGQCFVMDDFELHSARR